MVERCRAFVVGPGLGRAERHGRRRPGRSWPGRRSPWWSTPTVSIALGTGDEIGAVVRGDAGPGSPGGAHVVLTPHDGEFARLAGSTAGNRSHRRRGALAAALRGRGAAQGPDDGGGRPRRDGAAGHGRVAPAGHGGDRRRAVGRHRGVRGPGRRAAPRGGAWPRTSTVGPPSSALPRASWPGTSPSCVGRWLSGPAMNRPLCAEPADPRPCGSRPVWAEIDLGAVRHNASLLRRRGGTRPACVRWSRPTATATAPWPWPGPRWRVARRWLAVATPEEGVAAARRRHRRLRCSCCPSHRPTAMADVVERGLTLTLYSRRRRGGRRPPPRRAPAWSPTST